MKEEKVPTNSPMGAKISDDVYSRLLKNRIVLMQGPLEGEQANLVIAHLLYLENEDCRKDIRLIIDSPGGALTDCLALYDCIKLLSPPLSTICLGKAYCGASLILAAGAPGRRFALPTSKILMYQDIYTRRMDGEPPPPVDENLMKRFRTEIISILVKHTRQPEATVAELISRNSPISAQEAISLGVIDGIVERAPLL